MSEPRYDLGTQSWDKTCPCIRAEQRDPECPWHGRTVCPVHNMPDCSPLLNGCSRLTARSA